MSILQHPHTVSVWENSVNFSAPHRKKRPGTFLPGSQKRKNFSAIIQTQSTAEKTDTEFRISSPPLPQPYRKLCCPETLPSSAGRQSLGSVRISLFRIFVPYINGVSRRTLFSEYSAVNHILKNHPASPFPHSKQGNNLRGCDPPVVQNKIINTFLLIRQRRSLCESGTDPAPIRHYPAPIRHRSGTIRH